MRAASRRLSGVAAASSPPTPKLQRAPLAHIYDVTPRDGLQNEKRVLSASQKSRLLELVAQSNAWGAEACSFVREDLVPAMAGAADLCAILRDAEWAHAARMRGMQFGGLVPNMRGYETFHRHAPDTLDFATCLVSCSESHSRANVNMSLATALKTTMHIVRQAKADGFGVRGYASLAFQCPFEGAVDPEVVLDIVRAYIDNGADVIVLADTLGAAPPEQVRGLMSRVLELVPGERLGMHMHDAHGRAAENIAVGAELGVQHFDAALGGAGGCNFVPDAKGNVAVQAATKALDASGVPHGLDADAVRAATAFLEDALGRKLDQ